MTVKRENTHKMSITFLAYYDCSVTSLIIQKHFSFSHFHFCCLYHIKSVIEDTGENPDKLQNTIGSRRYINCKHGNMKKNGYPMGMVFESAYCFQRFVPRETDIRNTAMSS